MNTDQPPTVDPAARAMTTAIRTFIGELMRDVLRMDMQGGEAATNAYAHACISNLPEHRLPALVAAHDALAAALGCLPLHSLATVRRLGCPFLERDVAHGVGGRSSHALLIRFRTV